MPMFIRQLAPEDAGLFGIDPLKLAIGLVVLTILTAAGISFWVFGSSSRDSEDCLYSELNFYSGNFDSSKSLITLFLGINGSIESENPRLYIFYPGNMIVEKSLELASSASNGVKKFQSREILKDFEKVLLKTNCNEITLKYLNNGDLVQV
jgi:hypothetical protein